MVRSLSPSMPQCPLTQHMSLVDDIFHSSRLLDQSELRCSVDEPVNEYSCCWTNMVVPKTLSKLTIDFEVTGM